MKTLCIFFILFSTIFSLDALEKQEASVFAGNVIASSALNTETGLFDHQIFLSFTHLNGFYDNQSQLVSDVNMNKYGFELQMTYGLIKNVDFTLDIPGYQIHNRGRSSFSFGDIRAYFGFQLIQEGKIRYAPTIRFLVGEIFPSGKYDFLDEWFGGGDGSGIGAFSTFLMFIASQTYFQSHPLRWTLNVYYALYTKANLMGKNVYTDFPGEVKPGAQLTTDLAFEYKFNASWGCGMDIFFEQQNSSAFHSFFPEDPISHLPSSYTLSLAPSIEYNFNEKMNMIFGSWCTLVGRNDFSFQTMLFGFTYEF
ncbi:MAG: hypothetical protein R3E91_05760 [Chlamydiales bacterium]